MVKRDKVGQKWDISRICWRKEIIGQNMDKLWTWTIIGHMMDIMGILWSEFFIGQRLDIHMSKVCPKLAKFGRKAKPWTDIGQNLDNILTNLRHGQKLDKP